MTSIDLLAPASRSPVIARNVVSTSQPLAAQAGLEMLRRGGNAIDAALAAAIALVVVEPTGTGLGSDAFAIVWDGSALHGLNASGRSPAAWTPERFSGRNAMPERGWDSVTVPGAVAGWAALSERFGSLPFADLFTPAISYARDGFPVSPKVAEIWRRGAALLANQPGFTEHFLPGGEPPRAGALFRSEALARSLEEIAATRGQSLYRGDLARRIADFARTGGAALSRADLAEHRVTWCGTLDQSFAGHTVHQIPPNGQGLAALLALGILDRLHMADLPPDSAGSIHLQIEAMKLGFADTGRWLGDPAHMPVTAENLLDPAYLDRRASLIDRARAGTPGHGVPAPGGTVYVTAADASGRMVSLIQSNFMGFGSGVVVPGTGIALQNRGTSFVLTPNHPNQVDGGKLPFHTIIPGFVTRGSAPVLSFGVMGGAMQPQGHVQMAVRILQHGQNPQTASDAPRWRVIDGTRVAVESAMPATVIEELRRRGHDIVIEPDDPYSQFGGAQLALRLDNGVYAAGSDHRKDGQAVGW